MSTTVTVRGRYVGGSIYKTKTNETTGKEQFSACVVLDDGEDKKIEAIRDAAIKEVFGSKVPKLEDWTVRVGDDEEYEHSFGKKFINPKASATKVVKVCRRVAGELEETEDVYPGCYVAVSVNAYAYEGDKKQSIKPGVTLQLRAVLFTKDGEPLGDRFKDNEFDGFDSEETEAEKSIF